MPEPKLTEGWLKPIQARKFHYFRDGRQALCGRWLLLANGNLEPETGPGPDDCAACRRKLDKED